MNSYAAVLQKGGLDEAMNANVLIAAHEATRRAVAPRYSPSILSSIFQYLVLIPIYFVLGILSTKRWGCAGPRSFGRALVHPLFLPPSNTSTGASNSPRDQRG